MSGPADYKVELVTNRAAVPLTAEQWNALAAANETNTVFQTYEWFDAWWQAFGAGHKLFMLIVRQGEAIVGLAPMTLSRSKFGWRELRFAGAGNADYQDFILPRDKPGTLAAICRFLQSRAWRWDRLALGNVPSHSSTLALINATATDTGLRPVPEVRVTCPTLLLRADRASARRMIDKYSLRRPHNWFSKRGKLVFRHVTDLEEVVGMLPAFFEQHQQRWRAAGKPSQFERPLQRDFYTALARSLHSRGWLQFSVVEFNGAPIAFHFGFDYAGCVIWYKPTFAVQYAEHSPGLLLTRQLIEDGLNRDRIELDFTAGDEAFKGRFANQQRYNVHWGVYHGPISHAVARAICKLRLGAGRFLRRLRGGRPRHTEASSAPDLGAASRRA